MFSAQANRESELNYDSAQLMAALNITEADLQMNKQGQLSPDQCRRLEHEYEAWTWTKYIGWVAMPLLIAYTIFDGVRIGDSVSSRAGIIILIMIIFSAFSIVIRTKQQTTRADLDEGTVKVAQGSVQLFRYRRKNGTVYQVRINHLQWRISRPVYHLLRQNGRYVIYYAPQSKRVLAITPVDERERSV